MLLHMGLDVGSTTVKLVALNDKGEVLYATYQRHFSDMKKTVADILTTVSNKFPEDETTISVTGSGGIAVAEFLNVPFIQEVVAGTAAIEAYLPETDVAIELGGEDSKITYLRGSLEQRMNSICAGGTGQGTYKNLSHCIPLRGLCQDRRAGPFKSGSDESRHCRVGFSIRGQSDHLQFGLRPPHSREGRFFRRPPYIPG